MAHSSNIITITMFLLLWFNYTGPPEKVELAVAAHQWLTNRPQKAVREVLSRVQKILSQTKLSIKLPYNQILVAYN